MLINVNTIMVKGTDVGTKENKQNGKIHYIQLSLIKEGEYDLIMPSLEDSTKEKERLKTVINRIRGLKNIDQLRFRIDLRIDEDGNLDYQEQLDDLKSLELSIGISIQACCCWKDIWDRIWSEWSFSGVIDGLNCEIRKIDSLNAKLNAAVFNDDNIKYIMIPYDNKQETINWVKEEGIRYEEGSKTGIKITDNKKKPLLLSRVWSLATKNTITRIALILWILSIIYIPIRYLFWNDIQSWKSGIPQVTINLPVNNPKKVKEKLLGKGFPEDQLKEISLSSLTKMKQGRKVLITNRDGAIEFEITDLLDWTIISSYICCGYVILFAFVLVMIALRNNNSDIKENRGDINYDSVILPLINKEIIFVDNIKKAETIVEYKIHQTVG
ncbi:MAG: hypothetical protein ACE5KZ_08760 [Candidatus Scalinduaceae bacterium]